VVEVHHDWGSFLPNEGENCADYDHRNSNGRANDRDAKYYAHQDHRNPKYSQDNHDIPHAPCCNIKLHLLEGACKTGNWSFTQVMQASGNGRADAWRDQLSRINAQ
jgi:hypothetical protein